MNKLLKSTDKYLQKSTWKDLSLLKMCTVALGILFGIKVSENHKKGAKILFVFVFIITFIPLMSKYLSVLFEEEI